MSKYRGVRLRKGEPVMLRDPNGRLLAVVRYNRKHKAVAGIRGGPLWYVDIEPQVNVVLVEGRIPVEED